MAKRSEPRLPPARRGEQPGGRSRPEGTPSPLSAFLLRRLALGAALLLLASPRALAEPAPAIGGGGPVVRGAVPPRVAEPALPQAALALLAPLEARWRQGCGCDSAAVVWRDLPGVWAAASRLDSLRALADTTSGGTAREAGSLTVRLRGLDRAGTHEFVLGAELRCRAAGWLIRRTVRARSVLQPDDLERRVDWIAPGAVRAGRLEAAGAYARRAFVRGEWLRDTDLDRPPLVRKGEALRVLYLAPTFSLESVGTARTDGWMGDLIAVRMEGAVRDFRGKVIGADRIEVTEPGGTP